MSRPLLHALAAVAAYGFFPAFHCLVYVPIIVPALQAGNPFPWIRTLAAFAVVLLCLGAASGPRLGALHASVLALSIHLLSWYFGTRLEPGYIKEASGPYSGVLVDEGFTRVLPIAAALYLVIVAGYGTRRVLAVYLNAGTAVRVGR